MTHETSLGDAADTTVPRFANDSGFHADLRRRVSAFFQERGVSESGNWRLWLKTATILGWFAASYLLLVFVELNWWQGGLLAVSLGMAVAGIGFAIQHDANHGSYAKSKAANRTMSLTLDLLGASSHVWRWKHNVFHHTYTNIDGSDSDLDIGAMGRLSPHQKRRWFHRFQHIYLWGLYGLIGPKWQFIDDFQNVAAAKIGKHKFPRGTRGPLTEMFVAKVFFVAWAFVLPSFFHPIWVVVLFYVISSLVSGIVLSVVFQLAHCVENAEFPEASDGAKRMPDCWAVHQVRTTVDFAQGNPFLTWYLGGLNYQVEHHLFPRVSHIHYPSIAPIVEQTCRDHGVPYSVNRGFLQAVGSHFRWLRRMGRGEPAAA